MTLNSKTLPIFFTREILRCLWYCITLSAKILCIPGQMAKCAQPRNWLALLFSQKNSIWANFDQPSNCGDYNMMKYNISDVAVDLVGIDDRVKFGDSMLNSGQIIQLFAGHTRFTHFCTEFNSILRQIGSRWGRHIRYVCGPDCSLLACKILWSSLCTMLL